MRQIDITLRGPRITLDRLLKATGVAPSGGAAKQMVASGQVQVDGCPEARKTAQIRGGQEVTVPGARIRVHACLDSADTAAP